MMLPLAIGFGPQEIAIIAVLLILLFGVKRLPELGRGLAEGIHEFKKAARQIKEEDEAEKKPSETTKE
jgi:sec-independent protein translocase protein TatA